MLDNTGISLGTIGILQSRRRFVSSPIIVNTDVGSLLYTGFIPEATIVANPNTVVLPSTGQLTYTGFSHTSSTVTLNFNVTQGTAVQTAYWYVFCSIYNASYVLLGQISLQISNGTGDYDEDTYLAFGETPTYIDVQVSRGLDIPPGDNLTNDFTTVTWSQNSTPKYTKVVGLGSTFNDTYTYTTINTGDIFSINIWEG